MNFTLRIWRQKNAEAKGGMVSYSVSGVSADSSFFEMLDILNQQLVDEGAEPVCFDHDCAREYAEPAVSTSTAGRTDL